MLQGNVTFELDELGIAKITLNQSDKLNALGTEMADDLILALQQADADNRVKVIIITGTGRAFCAGGDINHMATNLDVITAQYYVGKVSEITKLVFDSSKLVIAAVNGLAIGAGFNLALAADFIIASSQAKLGQLFFKVGLVPDMGGTYFLPRIIGLHKAKELIYTGRIIDSVEAQGLGIVCRVIAEEVFAEGVYQFAADLAQGPACAMGMAKKLLHSGMQQSLHDVLEAETLAQSLCMQTIDHREGVQAFLQKRKPVFSA